MDMNDLIGPLRSERRARLDAAMRDEGFDVLVVAGNSWRCDALRYCTGAAVSEGMAIAVVESDGASRLFVETPWEADRLGAENPDVDVSWSTDIIGEAEQAIRGSRKRIGLATRTSLPHRLANGADAEAIARATAMMERLLLCKSPAELAATRRAAALADEGYEVFAAGAKPGRPEYALVADVEAFFRQRGCPDNFQILGSGGVEVKGMHPPGERTLRPGDLVTTELTPAIEGYYAQICRTLILGEPTSAHEKAFNLFNEAMEAGIDAVKPGTTAAVVARQLNDVFRKYGFGDYVTSQYTRVRGHALGLGTGQRPSILEDIDVTLEEDMVLIVHPNTYHPDIGYFVHGDTLIVTRGGCEVLCKTPRKLFTTSISA